MNTLRWLLIIALLGLSHAAGAQQTCEPSGGLRFVCGPKNAEDLVRVPGTRWIIGSGAATDRRWLRVEAWQRRFRPRRRHRASRQQRQRSLRGLSRVLRRVLRTA